MGDDDKRQSERPLLRDVFNLASQLITKAVAAVTNERTVLLTIFVVGVLAGIYLVRLPERELASIDFGDFVSGLLALAESAWVTVLGWLVAAFVALVSAVVIFIQHGRIGAQGAELARLREQIDPKRLSAGSRQDLADYGKKAESRFRVSNDGG